jgi:hypothetical protein
MRARTERAIHRDDPSPALERKRSMPITSNAQTTKAVRAEFATSQWMRRARDGYSCLLERKRPSTPVHPRRFGQQR